MTTFTNILSTLLEISKNSMYNKYHKFRGPDDDIDDDEKRGSKRWRCWGKKLLWLREDAVA